MMATHAANFSIGQLIQHRFFGYRGVIVDADPIFQGSEEWYEQIALTRPARDKPWYHVLIDGGIHRAYVPEANLEADLSGEPISHPELSDFFSRFSDGIYIPLQPKN